jgi:L-fuculose-phosphate aldolase
VALSLAGLEIPDDALPEVVMLLGSIPTAPFAPPCSASGAKAIRKLILTHDAIILDRHGALTIGKTLTEAWFNLERLEYAARVTLLAHTIGAPKKLTPTQKKQLVTIAAQYRLTK